MIDSNYLSGKLFLCFTQIFFMDYFFVLLFETYPFVFSFCLTFSVKRSEAVAYAGLEGMSF